MNIERRNYVDLVCPMPDCGKPLDLRWELSIALYTEEGHSLADELPTPDSTHTSDWTVTCQDGHTVLVPGPAGCDCDDEGGENCPHIDTRDWSEEDRTFRAHDAARLEALIEQLAAVNELKLRDTRHILDLRADGWTLQHPLTCRPNLHDCAVNRLASEQLSVPPAPPGRYEVEANDLGDLLCILDRVDDEAVAR